MESNTIKVNRQITSKKALKKNYTPRGRFELPRGQAPQAFQACAIPLDYLGKNVRFVLTGVYFAFQHLG